MSGEKKTIKRDSVEMMAKDKGEQTGPLPGKVIGSFPVQYSTLSPEALQERILQKYPLKKILVCEYLYRGLNDNYLVRDTCEKYILRVYRHNWRDLRDIESETELLLYLKGNGVSVSTPIADKSDRLIQEIQAPEGLRYAVLFSYAKGNSPFSEMTTKQSRVAGKELARMHCVTTGMRLKNNRCHLDMVSLLYESFHAIKPFIEDSRDDLRDLEEIIQKLKARFETISLDGLSSGICHGDLYPSNYHLSGENEITFFDFDACCCSWFVFDLASFCYTTTQFYWNAEQINNAFIDGYQELRKLTKEEIRLIPYFGAVKHIWVLGTQCSSFEVFCHFVRSNIKRNIIANLKTYVDKYCC
jgi:Ser/Thr protein kinase RdoA (MazF antagonist)